MNSVADFGKKGLGSRPGYQVLYPGKILNSHSASLHLFPPGIGVNTGELLGRSTKYWGLGETCDGLQTCREKKLKYSGQTIESARS